MKLAVAYPSFSFSSVLQTLEESLFSLKLTVELTKILFFGILGVQDHVFGVSPIGIRSWSGENAGVLLGYYFGASMVQHYRRRGTIGVLWG